ncbi:mucin-7, partial [Exaiptasia diaphana]|uniref:SEA domain-containing protein n=1 Tax=Exaiptasia diaphana TaxID=2652724 RepID=A0A913YS90_EXADI
MNLVALSIILVAIPHSFAGVIGWGSWTPCTVSCGGGNRSRTAICKTGGNSCTRDKGKIVVGENQTASCNLQPCTTGVPSSPPPRTMPITNATEERNTTGKATGGVSTRATPPAKPTGKINTTEQQNTTTTPEKTTNPSTITKNTTAKPTKNTHKETSGVTTHAAHESHNHGGGEGTSFEGQMKMEKQFSKDLEDKNSKAFKDLKT